MSIRIGCSACILTSQSPGRCSSLMLVTTVNGVAKDCSGKAAIARSEKCLAKLDTAWLMIEALRRIFLPWRAWSLLPSRMNMVNRSRMHPNGDASPEIRSTLLEFTVPPINQLNDKWTDPLEEIARADPSASPPLSGRQEAWGGAAESWWWAVHSRCLFGGAQKFH